MFGSSMFMLQYNKGYGNQEDLIKPISGIAFLDMILNQYLLSLGEFAIDEFEGHPQKELCWLFFFMATFLTSITMLNMLIAVMGNTFDMVMEKKAIHGMQTKLQIMSEYTNLISMFDKESHHFLFIVQPVVDEDDLGDEIAWEGGFNLLRKTMIKNKDQLDQKLAKIQG